MAPDAGAADDARMTVATTVMASAAVARNGVEPASVRLSRVTKRFAVRRSLVETLRHPRSGRRTTVVDDVSCDIAAGEFFGFLGPNGAGKTTIFKMLATLVTPDAGAISVCGADAVREAARVRRVLAPVIADERSLNWRLSATENLRLFSALHGRQDEAPERRTRDMLDLVGLSVAGDRPVGLFSSGMRQRLLIARALLARPSVLLLDEPTRSLDPVSARGLRQFLRDEVSRRQGCTILLATHTAEEVFELCDRVAVLDRGRLLAVGAADALAREFGEERYCVWTTTPQHPAWGMLERGQLLAGLARSAAEPDGWTRVGFDVPGGMPAAARVLDHLVGAGVTVARFERTPPALAELIERIVAQAPTGTRTGDARA